MSECQIKSCSHEAGCVLSIHCPGCDQTVTWPLCGDCYEFIARPTTNCWQCEDRGQRIHLTFSEPVRI